MSYRAIAEAAAGRYGIPTDLFLRQIGAESAWQPDAVSPAGAIGLGQLMPSTAAELGVDPNDPEQNIDGAARYLRQQFDRFGDWKLALAAYNAGPGAVERYGGVPPFEETQNYVAKLFGEGGDTGGGYGGGSQPPQGSNAFGGMTPEMMNALAEMLEPERQTPQIGLPDFSMFKPMRRL